MPRQIQQGLPQHRFTSSFEEPPQIPDMKMALPMSCTPDKNRLQPLFNIMESTLQRAEGEENVDSEMSFHNHAELVLDP